MNRNILSPKYKHVYQFKVELADIQPLIWRRIQVPENYTFWDFHVAIQDAMGWLDYHLHEFEIENLKSGKKEILGIPDDDPYPDLPKKLPDWKYNISDYFSEEKRTTNYLYDFGDGWQHLIKYEGIFFKNPALKYPLCLAGERSGPPEDCGGTGGYENFLQIINDPYHKEYESMRIWAGKNKCETEIFDANKVHFDNPVKRWKFAIGNNV